MKTKRVTIQIRPDLCDMKSDGYLITTLGRNNLIFCPDLRTALLVSQAITESREDN